MRLDDSFRREDGAGNTKERDVRHGGRQDERGTHHTRDWDTEDGRLGRGNTGYET